VYILAHQGAHDVVSRPFCIAIIHFAAAMQIFRGREIWRLNSYS